MKNRELVYWVDLTGPAPLDEIGERKIFCVNSET